MEPLVLHRGQRTVQVVPLLFAPDAARPTDRNLGGAFPPTPPRSAKDLGAVNRVGMDDGADRVEEIELLAADQRRELGGEIRRRQRTGRQDDRRARRRLGNPPHFLAPDLDQRFRLDGRRNALREPLAVDGQRTASRHACLVADPHDQRIEPAHLFLEQPHRVLQGGAAEGVAADQLRQPIGTVHRGRPNRTHFVERNRDATRGDLPRRLAPRQSAPDDPDHRTSADVARQATSRDRPRDVALAPFLAGCREASASDATQRPSR